MRLRITHQLNDSEESDVANWPDAGMLRLHALMMRAERLPHRGGAGDQVVLLVDLDRGEGGRTGERMAVVGQTAPEHLLGEVIGDRPSHAERAELHVGAGQALRHGDHVGHDAGVINGEPLPCSAEPGHHLVGDQHDAVAITDVTQPLHVAIWRNQDSVCTDNWLNDNRRNGVWSLKANDLLGLCKHLSDRAWLGGTELVEIWNAEDARHARLGEPATRIASSAERSRGAAVVRAIACGDLVTARIEARNAEGVLDRLSATVGEEEGVNVARADLGQLRAESGARLRRHEWIRVGEGGRLIRDRLQHSLITVADVGAHQLAVEVEELLLFGGPEPGALRSSDRNRVRCSLGGPFGHGVALGEGDHLWPAQWGSLGCAHRPSQ